MTNQIPSPFDSRNIPDKGHDQLLDDLELLLKEAENFDYHDYKSQKHAAPKIVLVGELDKIMARVKNGWYNN